MVGNKIRFSDIQHLISDETFVEWRLTSSEETSIYWESKLKNDPELVQKVAKADRYLRNYIHYAQEQLTTEDKNRLFNRIQQTIANVNPAKRNRIPSWIKYAAAASVILFVGFLGYYNTIQRNYQKTQVITGAKLQSECIQLIAGDKTTAFNENIDIQVANGTIQIKGKKVKDEIAAGYTLNKLIVPFGKRTKVELPDGSKIWLNSGSELEFPSKFANDKREIRLKGELFIEVSKDKERPFYVYTEKTSTQVLGTKFNVSAYAGYPTSVVLEAGKVMFRSNTSNPLMLEPSEMLILSNSGSINKSVVDISQFISWKDGYLTFNDTPIEEVLMQLEKYYNLKFNFLNSTNKCNFWKDSREYFFQKRREKKLSLPLLKW